MERQIESGMPGWKVIRRIGEGSYSVVYEIERDNFGAIEKAAVKVISIPHSESETVEYLSNGYDMDGIASRFRERMGDLVKEYNTMVRLKDCPNIVHCDDYITLRKEDGVGWYILIRMELLRALPAYLGSGAIKENQALQLGLDIAYALIRCQREGIIHRDIKPHNIFVSKDGIYKLGDFGVARSLDHSAGATMIGTFNYMAPEVIQQKRYGFRADLYSLGLVLYWMLNERRGPFLPLPPQMNTALQEEDARARRFSGEPLPPPKHGSPRLKEIVLRACAYSPEDRYRSAEDLYADLYSLAENTSPRSYMPLPNGSVHSIASPTSMQAQSLASGMNVKEETQPAEPSRAQDSDQTQLAEPSRAQDEDRTQLADGLRMQDEDRTQLADGHIAHTARESTPVGDKPATKHKNRLVVIVGSLGITAAIIFLICWRTLLTDVQPVSTANSAMPELEIESSMEPDATVEPTLEPTSIATPVPTVKPANGSVNPDSSAEEIKALQWRLIELGWLDADTASGVYDEATHHAVTCFQNTLQSLGVDAAATGYADETTMEWLNNSGAPTPTPAPLYTYRVNQYYYTAVDGIVNSEYDSMIEGELLTTTETSMIVDAPPSAIDGYIYAPESGDNLLAMTHSDPNAVYEYRAVYIKYTEKPAFVIPENMKGIQISAGHDHSVVLKPDGTVLGFGSNVDDRNKHNVLQVNQSKVSGWSDIIAVSAGEYHTVGLRADGTVVSVGQDKEGQRNMNKWKDIVDIAAGEYHTVGLKADGSLVAVGRDKKGQCQVQSLLYAGAARVTDIAAGYEHTVVLREDGTVSCIGDNSRGQGNVYGWSDIVAIEAGTEHTVGLRADGTVVATGRNDEGQCNVSAWTDIIAIAAGDYFTVGLRSDGTVVAIGLNDEGQCNVEGWTDIVAIGAGNDHTLGVRIDGSGIGTGRNDRGQLSAFNVLS